MACRSLGISSSAVKNTRPASELHGICSRMVESETEPATKTVSTDYSSQADVLQ